MVCEPDSPGPLRSTGCQPDPKLIASSWMARAAASSGSSGHRVVGGDGPVATTGYDASRSSSMTTQRACAATARQAARTASRTPTPWPDRTRAKAMG
jgi:hypothetical protein